MCNLPCETITYELSSSDLPIVSDSLAANVQNWSPCMRFIWRALKFQPLIWDVDSNPRHQSKNMETKYETFIKLVHVLELSSNSSWFLVGSWLFAYKLSMFGKFLVHAWRGSVEVWTKNILHWFMEGQTHFSTSWHAKMSVTLHEPI